MCSNLHGRTRSRVGSPNDLARPEATHDVLPDLLEALETTKAFYVAGFSSRTVVATAFPLCAPHLPPGRRILKPPIIHKTAKN